MSEIFSAWKNQCPIEVKLDNFRAEFVTKSNVFLTDHIAISRPKASEQKISTHFFSNSSLGFCQVFIPQFSKLGRTDFSIIQEV